MHLTAGLGFRAAWLLLLVFGADDAYSAINLDGDEAVSPVSADSDDASPIDGLDRYWPEQHDCPLSCTDFANIHSWIPYISVGRLQRCQQPMLLQLSVSQALDDPASTILIRSCTLGSGTSRIASDSVIPVENPKTAGYVFESSFDVYPACKSDGIKAPANVQLLEDRTSKANADQVASLVDGMKAFFEAPDNCDESFIFAYHNDIVASAYVGKSLGKKTATSAMTALSDRMRSLQSCPTRTIAQICNSRREPSHIFGVAINTNGDLAAVQQSALNWSKGQCPVSKDLQDMPLPGAEVWEVSKNLEYNNGTRNGTGLPSSNESIHSSNTGGVRPGALSGLLRGNTTDRASSVLSSISSFLIRTKSARSSTIETTQSTQAPASFESLVGESSSRTWDNHSRTSDILGFRNTNVPSDIFTTSSGSSPEAHSSSTSTASHSDTSRSSVAEYTILPSTTAGTTFRGDGGLNCTGRFRSRNENGTQTFNGTLRCDGVLTSNGTLNCDGIVSTPRHDSILSSNGTLVCNGTIHGNGTIEHNPNVACNGTLYFLTEYETLGSNSTLTCNGTLSGNGTLRRDSVQLDGQTRKHRHKRQSSGTCATHLIHNGDTCFTMGEQYGVTVDEIEAWNKGKTWGWQGCEDLLVGYNMCVGDGAAPMPAPQQGTQCGPLVPGTRPPTDPSISLADLNPCPLKACCSNWGFCGVFPAHCTINAPEGAAPGAKYKDAQNTCVSNCGTAIKQNSGPPASFGRVGYYSAFAYDRQCLHLRARDANTDGSYTIIHWAFAEIDPNTWDVVITDPGDQWEEFKALQGVKRIVSFGGWAYSTEPDTYNIIRQAILTNYETFTNNIVRFVQEHDLDGVDVDWEYPGAPDILVNGSPIGQRNDGRLYLRFLRVLRSKLGSDKLMAIAAPASFWYCRPVTAVLNILA